MSAVFVNGNPETAAVWAPMLAALDRPDVVTLCPPGFGAPVPDDFGATADEYLAWLIAELEALGEPVDLVGHDWGANHVFRLASARPDLIRSWCIDTAGVFAPDYEWHPATLDWQTPEKGEASIALLLDMGVAGRAALYEALGVPPAEAVVMAEGVDAAMGRCILSLYRSAGQPVLAEWSSRVAAAGARPGLVLVPTDDVYTGGEARHRWTAEQTGAQLVVLEGLGHWWLVQDPAAGASTLRTFWAGLDGAEPTA